MFKALEKIFLFILIFYWNVQAQNFTEVFVTSKNPNLNDLIKKEVKRNPLYKYIGTSSNVGIDTKIYGYWDYQNNGGAINYIDINPNDPNNIHIVTMTSSDSTDAVTVSMSRRVFYNFSNDGGQTWGIPKAVPNVRAGYPSLITAFDLNESYIAAIASHNSINGYLRSSLYLDISEGEGFFFTYPTPLIQPNTDNTISPVIAQTSNGNILLVSSAPMNSALSGIWVNVFDLGYRTWGNWMQIESSPYHSGRVTVATGTDGYAAIIWRSNTNPDSLLCLQTTNNGINWGNKIVVDYENGITGPCWTGFDAIYNGTDLYIVFTRSRYNSSGYFLSNEVCFWKSTTQNIVTAVDSNTYPYLMKSTGSSNIQTNHNFAFNFPSISINNTKNRIFIGVDVFNQGETDQQGFNYGDLLLCYSDDFGLSWSLPQNITRTIDLDERYISLAPLSPQINDSNYVFLLYQEDRIPGANYATNSNESRPISGVKTKFLKYNSDHIARGIGSIQVNTNWNMISLPIDTILVKNIAFPSASSNAFTLGSEGSYVVENNLKMGKAYWVKFSTSNNFDFYGKKPMTYKVFVKKGWNMIGAPTGEIPVDKITTTPPGIISSKFYGYSTGYVAVNILTPGKGYWVKVSSDGYLNYVLK